MTNTNARMHVKVPPDHIFVMFGAYGDLAKRKVLPGLFHLAVAGLLPKNYRIIGCSRQASAMSMRTFESVAYDSVCEFGTNKPEGSDWEEVREEPLLRLRRRRRHRRTRWTRWRGPKARSAGRCSGSSIWPFPPGALLGIIQMLGKTGLNENTKIICEKPFGTGSRIGAPPSTPRSPSASTSPTSFESTTSSQGIDRQHLALRFANGLYEPIWNRHYVSYVQIDVPETISIEGRGDVL